MGEGTFVVEADGLGMKYRRGWALRDCSFRLPAGRVTALVGPNGAGKSTLLELATGLLRPSAGSIRVLGNTVGDGGMPPKAAYLSQDRPLYRSFTVAETLRLGRELNPDFDQPYAEGLIRQAGLPMTARVGTLSGGQRTTVALALVLARHPELILLDEPLADLDPLARQQTMGLLMAEVAETGANVLLSSHVIADLEGVCDHLLLLRDGQVELAGDIEDLLNAHTILTGPAPTGPLDVTPHALVEARLTERQATTLIRTNGQVTDPRWALHSPTLEELVLAYLRTPHSPLASHRGAVAA